MKRLFLLLPFLLGAPAVQVSPSGSVIKTSQVYKGLVVDLPLITGWGQGTQANNRGSGGHATLVNASLGADGVDLNGSNGYIDLGSDHSFANAGQDLPFSLGCWVNMDDSTQFQIMRKDGISSGREYLLVTTSADKLAITVFTNGANYIGIISDAALTSYENSWVHLFGTYDGTEVHTGMTLYVNGSSVAATSNNNGTHTGMVASSEPLEIGRQSTGTNYSDGGVSFCRIHERKLSADDVNDIFVVGRKVLSINVTP